MIEDYAALESTAFKLIRANITPEDDDITVEHKDSEMQNEKKHDKFDYFEYCKKQGFDLQNEISKEKNIRDFFQQRYKIQSFSLGDNIMRRFLNTDVNYNHRKPSVTELNKRSGLKSPSDYTSTLLIVDFLSHP
eukprot:TRINITY_DN7345_c0_g2_i1.p1 TRINITY_DN7345_c0_g2~~TRINITY_DN7345_c0_g2_i1.p1  ORF type:complete len:134 (-),score=29.80 TRINITY_DN7345_c0_g2_i1:343-744(-)